MLYWLFDSWLSQFYSPFSAVSSLTLRALLTVITSLAFSIMLGPRTIAYLRSVNMTKRSVMTALKLT